MVIEELQQNIDKHSGRLKRSNISIEGKHAVIIGRSNIVGKPVAGLLLNENATVTICHSKTTNLKEICKTADILVVAIGKAKFIDKSFCLFVVAKINTSEQMCRIVHQLEILNCFHFHRLAYIAEEMPEKNEWEKQDFQNNLHASSNE